MQMHVHMHIHDTLITSFSIYHPWNVIKKGNKKGIAKREFRGKSKFIFYIEIQIFIQNFMLGMVDFIQWNCRRFYRIYSFSHRITSSCQNFMSIYKFMSHSWLNRQCIGAISKVENWPIRKPIELQMNNTGKKFYFKENLSSNWLGVQHWFFSDWKSRTKLKKCAHTKIGHIEKPETVRGKHLLRHVGFIGYWLLLSIFTIHCSICTQNVDFICIYFSLGPQNHSSKGNPDVLSIVN